MGLEDLVQWLTSLPLNRTIRRTAWAIPLLQTIHILATAIVLSSVVMLDLRVWGGARSHTSIESAQRFAPWIWIAMVLLIVTGIGLVIAAPRRMLLDGSFQVKMLLMAMAVPLTVALQVAVRRALPDMRTVVGIMGVSVLLLWIVVTFLGHGRWIAGMLPK
jgi:hypothetical protein